MVPYIESPSRLSMARRCSMLAIPRCTYYRVKHQAKEPSNQEQELIDLLHRTCEDQPCYGYRRICMEIRHKGVIVNHKRVLRLMRQQGLLIVPRRRFVHTTNSKHRLHIYENLVKQRVVKMLNEIWVSDITYIAYAHTFAYLAIILDAWSRKVIGWKLRRHIDTKLTLGALEMALETRDVPEGLIHHSDRGIQYASKDYVHLLNEHNIRISMSAAGNPYENAKAESFMKTIKHEEVYRSDYDTFEEVKESIQHYIENIYNANRLHSSIGYTSPTLFEQKLTQSQIHQTAILTSQKTVSL